MDFAPWREKCWNEISWVSGDCGVNRFNCSRPFLESLIKCGSRPQPTSSLHTHFFFFFFFLCLLSLKPKRGSKGHEPETLFHHWIQENSHLEKTLLFSMWCLMRQSDGLRDTAECLFTSSQIPIQCPGPSHMNPKSVIYLLSNLSNLRVTKARIQRLM